MDHPPPPQGAGEMQKISNLKGKGIYFFLWEKFKFCHVWGIIE